MNNNLYRTATIKLTFWYLAIAMAISLLFSGVVYHVARDELAARLRNQTARIYQTYPVFTNDPFFVRDNDASVGSQHILTNLLYANLAVLIGAGIGSYLLAKRTLQPIAAANEQQRQFVADASHELRTPVTALKMETEVALMDKTADKAALRGALQSNLEEADKLEKLLNSLLRLSKLDSDIATGAFTATDLENVIQDAVSQTARQSSAKGIHVDIKMHKPLLALGDKDSLTQLFVILIDNAVKYSPEGSAITITSAMHDTQLQVTVADQGVGIEREALGHVFDRFYRADKARTSNNGFGLGLAIAKQIADLHQGSITLKSAVGKGTKAIVSLPQPLNDPAA